MFEGLGKRENEEVAVLVGSCGGRKGCQLLVGVGRAVAGVASCGVAVVWLEPLAGVCSW